MTLESPLGTATQGSTEQLPTPERGGANIGVVAIDGFRWAGVSTVSQDLATLVAQRTGNQPTLLSYDSEYARLREDALSTIGIKSEEDIHREVDRRIASQMMDPANKGKVLIIEGSRMPFVARQLEREAKDSRLALQEGQPASILTLPEGTPFPAKIVTAFIYADTEARYERKYKGQPSEWRNHAKRQYELERIEEANLQSFWMAYPNFTGENPASISFNVAGRPVYDLFYDSTNHTSMDIALKIFESNHFKNQILPV
jgi:hypothetical protein